MSRTPSPFKLGLFVVGGVTLVVVGLFALGLRRRLEERAGFETYITGSVSGVVAGSAVKLHGVNVGEVTGLEFSWIEYPGGRPSCVVVRFDIRASALRDLAMEQAVAGGLRATIESEGITGVAYLSLADVDPAENPPLHVSWAPHRPVIPSAPSQLDQIIRAVRSALASLQQVDFARLGARLDRLVEAVNDSLDRLDAQRLSADLRANADRVGVASEEVAALARDVRGAVRGLRLEALGRDASALVASLRDTNARLQVLIDRLSDVDPTEVRETLGSLHEAVRGLNEAIAELQGYPSGFFFGEAPPPARSVQRSP